MGPGVKPVTLEVERCRCCGDFVSVTTDPLDANGHCAMCAAPQEAKCGDCGLMWREDLVVNGLCVGCQADHDHDDIVPLDARWLRGAAEE